jgi:hypothetical protein
MTKSAETVYTNGFRKPFNIAKRGFKNYFGIGLEASVKVNEHLLRSSFKTNIKCRRNYEIKPAAYRYNFLEPKVSSTGGTASLKMYKRRNLADLEKKSESTSFYQLYS